MEVETSYMEQDIGDYVSDNESHFSDPGDFKMDDTPPDDWTMYKRTQKKIKYEKNPPLRQKQKRRLLRKLYVCILTYTCY